jgi:hypothetical protein
MKLDSRKRFLDWATLRLKPGREFEFLSQRFERFIDGKSGGSVASSNSTPPGSRK